MMWPLLIARDFCAFFGCSILALGIVANLGFMPTTIDALWPMLISMVATWANAERVQWYLTDRAGEQEKGE